ncbi:MAG TPA: hypothetical protein VF416_11020, partial [Marmoricola sp.]
MGSTTDSPANVRHEQNAAPGETARAGDDTSDSSWLNLPEVAVARRRTLRVLLVAQVLGSLGIGAAPSIGVLLAQELTRS